MEKEEDICGEVIDIHHDKKVQKLNSQLVHVGGDVTNGDGYYAIDISDWTKESKHLVRLHILDAISLKAVIDKLVFETTIIPKE
jgi:hypothetical protein